MTISIRLEIERYRQFSTDELLKMREMRERRVEAIKSIYLEITMTDRLTLSRVGQTELAYCKLHLRAINAVIAERQQDQV